MLREERINQREKREIKISGGHILTTSTFDVDCIGLNLKMEVH
jgi:hypothetical protein